MKEPSNLWEEEPYLKKQLLTYLGNKRKLLPLIYKALLLTSVSPSQAVFLDLFAGSGVVSRLAKKMGFATIITNDWEEYSYVTQKLFLEENPTSIKELFIKRGGLKEVLTFLNSQEALKGIDPYMSKHYAPQDLSYFDLNRERLFYTPRNAKKIDSIRQIINDWYPAQVLKPIEKREKNTLIALLLYKASIHTNTSGVFKAYYKDFGGYGKNSLSRILKPLILDPPFLIEGTKNIQTFKEDALELVQKLNKNPEYTGENVIVYLDPPYNIHQYGSNYHILNTIALWDKPNLSSSYTPSGLLKKKAGIREDWNKTKSLFCSKTLATHHFLALITDIKAKLILVSYSTDGIIPFSTLLDILFSKGKTQILMSPYTKYRGGRKSAGRKNSNIEFVLIVYCGVSSDPKDRQEIEKALLEAKLYIQSLGIYKGKVLKEFFSLKEGALIWKKNQKVVLKMNEFGELEPAPLLVALSLKEQETLRQEQKEALCTSKQEEIKELIERFSFIKKKALQGRCMEKALNALKFIAYKKTQKDFLFYFKALIGLLPNFDLQVKEKYRAKLESIDSIFIKRGGRDEAES